jgi:hypothetical protein
VVAVAVLSYVKFGTEIAWPWYALIGAATTIGIGLLAHVVLPTKRFVEPAREADEFRDGLAETEELTG